MFFVLILAVTVALLFRICHQPIHLMPWSVSLPCPALVATQLTSKFTVVFRAYSSRSTSSPASTSLLAFDQDKFASPLTNKLSKFILIVSLKSHH